jgi:hypothetical protein
MSILNICEDADVLSVIKIIKLIIDSFRIIVPILLLVSLSIDFLKATASHDADMVKKASKLAMVKGIAVVIIFFVPNFVNMIIMTASSDDTYKVCLENATTENINAAYAVKAGKLMDIAEEKVSFTSYYAAKRAVKRIVDDELREGYEAQLEELKVVLDAKSLVNKAKASLSKKDYQKAVSAVDELEDGDIKDELTKELEAVARRMSKNTKEYSSNATVGYGSSIGNGYIDNALGIPYYNQCDTRWGNIAYSAGGGSDGGPATFCSSSCGYTSFAMVVAGLNGDMTITPPTIVYKLRGISPGELSPKLFGAASPEEMRSNASYYGLKYEDLKASDLSQDDATMKAINENKVIVVNLPGHYVVLAPSTKANEIVLLDPFWGNRNGSYTIEGLKSLLNSTNNPWEWYNATAFWK